MHRDIEIRLENWGKAQRTGAGGGRAIGSAEGRYVAPSIEKRVAQVTVIDLLDADEVEQAWRKIMPFDKEVLRMHYILRMDPRVICRKLRIPHRPVSTFNMALSHAKREIEKVLDRMTEKRRAHVARQKEVDRLIQRFRE
ncbi:hypothetical protein [Burkholderia pseudomallei]|uniref:Uncharacterized protein n=1 Tax=Burkholderia phage phi644-2 TaxID=2881400 RepID=A4JX61_9CAUD|nr:hypothetical protein [Burkholderia pseudomallei]YP_001111145.1 gp66, conserved hypothetical protein [Burkholderia phage phi644-2]ABO60855.1 gp66, conserved hypothetical protein [Burkholderia phage phi644-2]